MRVDWLGQLRIALRNKTVRRRHARQSRVASFEVLEDRALLAADFEGGLLFGTPQKIAGDVSGGPAIGNLSNFGGAVASLGDLNGDGVADLVVGAAGDRSAGMTRGAVYVEFMNADGSVQSSQMIASGIGGGPTLANGDYFGISLASLGDLDGDGVGDLAVGANLDDTGGSNRGAVHVLFMNSNGTVKSSRKIASGTNGGPALANYDFFGSSVAAVGDLDGDGVTELAVGAKLDDTGGTARGAVHLLFLNANGTVRSRTKIASGTAAAPVLANDDRFGDALAAIGDLDGDGVRDLAVSSFANVAGEKNRGGVHILFLHADGTIKGSQTIANGVGNGPTLADRDQFGSSIAAVGDLDGDGVKDLAIGANYDDTAGSDQGAVYLLMMNSDGTAKSQQKIASGMSGGPSLSPSDYFGSSVSLLGDLNGDGLSELAVGASSQDAGGPNRGAMYVLFRESNVAPQFTSPDFAAVAENSTDILTVTATDSDVPADALAFSIVGGADQSHFAITTGGALTFAAPPDFDAPLDADADNRYEVIVEVNDGHGGTATQTILVEVTPVSDNIPQFTSPDSASVAENSTAVLTVTATDADLPAEAVVLSIVGGADQAQFSLSAAGEVTFNTAPDFELPADADGDNVYELIVEANDGTGGTATQTIQVSVTPINEHAPQFTSPESVSVAENSAVVLTVAATDADLPADTLTFSIVGGADQAAFTITGGGKLTLVSAPDFELPADADANNEYEVVVEASDGQGGAATQTIRVIVTPVNDHTPQFTSPDSASVAENSTSVLTVMATDADLPAETITLSIVGGADQSQFTLSATGEVAFNTAPDFELPTDFDSDNVYELIIEANDGAGGTATQTILVTVTPANDNIPLFTSLDSASVAENSTSVLTVTATDADLPADAITFSIVGGADQTAFSISAGGELTFVSAPDFELPADADANNEYEVIVEASDGLSGSATQTIRVTVTPVNDHTPQFTSPDTASAAENTTAVLTVTATDADLPADTLTFSIVGGADQTAFAITAGGELTFVSAPDFELPADADVNNEYEVVVEASDGQGGAATQTIRVTVTPVDEGVSAAMGLGSLAASSAEPAASLADELPVASLVETSTNDLLLLVAARRPEVDPAPTDGGELAGGESSADARDALFADWESELSTGLAALLL